MHTLLTAVTVHTAAICLQYFSLAKTRFCGPGRPYDKNQSDCRIERRGPGLLSSRYQFKKREKSPGNEVDILSEIMAQ